jgi:hypothetical protein
LNLALLKLLIKKKQLIIYKIKKTKTKILKVKAFITLFKLFKNGLIKAFKKVIIVKKVKRVIIY